MSDGIYRTERGAGGYFLLAVVTAVSLFAGGAFFGSIPLTSLGALLSVQALVAGIAFIHGRLRRLAAREAAEVAALGEREGALFGADSEFGDADRQRALRQFERFGVPILTVVVGASSVVLGVWVWSLGAAAGLPAGSAGALLPMPVLVGLLAVAFAFFLLSKLLVGLGQSADSRLLTAPGEQGLLGAFALGVTAALGIAAELFRGSESRFPALVPAFVSRALAVVLVVLGVELLIGLLLEFYRPRSRGEGAPGVPVYESRLCGLLTRPGGFVRGLADMLDYQFGFGVSETWLYRFALRSALPLCGFAAFCLLVFSCVVSVNPGERAVVETWGMPSEAVREPGLSLKLPWPIQRVKRVYPERVRELTVGAVDASGTGLWLVEGVEDDLFLSAGSPTDDQRPAVADADPDTSRRGTGIPAANLLAVGLTVRYEISDIADYLYRYSEPEAVLLSVARREMTAFLATHDGLDLHRRQGGELASALQERLNGLSEELHMGVRITWTAVSRLQPPGPVVGAFRAVASEMQQSETRALAARRYASETVPLGEAVAAERVSSAHASVVSRVSQAKAFADLFRQRREDNATNPDLYRALRLLSTLEDGLAGLPKVVIGADGGGEVFQIDLKDSTVPELLDFGVPTGSGE